MTSAADASSLSRRGASRLAPRLAIALFAGFFLYCALSLLVGPAGIAAYRRLEERKTDMEANLAELDGMRQSLNAELNSLKNDPDRAAREARSLGFLRKDETAIILGQRTENLHVISAGKVLPYADPPALGDAQLKEISFGAFLAVLAVLLAPRRSGSASGPAPSEAQRAAIGRAWSKRHPERNYYPRIRRPFRSR